LETLSDECVRAVEVVLAAGPCDEQAGAGGLHLVNSPVQQAPRADPDIKAMLDDRRKRSGAQSARIESEDNAPDAA
jgi:hypothetical protein